MDDFESLNGRSSFDSQAKNHPPHSGIGVLFRRPETLAVHWRKPQDVRAFKLSGQSTLAGHWRYTDRRSNPVMVITPVGKKEWTLMVQCKG